MRLSARRRLGPVVRRRCRAAGAFPEEERAGEFASPSLEGGIAPTVGHAEEPSPLHSGEELCSELDSQRDPQKPGEGFEGPVKVMDSWGMNPA